MTQPIKPDNTHIDYLRAQDLENAIRLAARTYGYAIIDIHIRADNSGREPHIEMELAQLPATYAYKP